MSLFAKSKVAWPDLLTGLFRFMQFFTFDIDMTAPECQFRQALTFETKWYLKAFIPFLGAGAILIFCLISFVVNSFQNQRKVQRRMKLIGVSGVAGSAPPVKSLSSGRKKKKKKGKGKRSKGGSGGSCSAERKAELMSQLKG